MPALLVFLVILFSLAAAGAFIYFHQSRKIFREQKNYERGLKMVPLLIHLPPPSSDTEKGSRDERDVVDETISKAQTLYNIIASSTTKGFKSQIYGQRHVAFEIVGTKGFVHFYAAVPVAMVELVQQAVTSAYPTARLEEVAEHNIFSPVGKTTGTMGGELTLKEDSAYPIATFQELKRDPIQSLLNALSTLEKEDGAGVQLLIRPAENAWRKNTLSYADKKRKGEKKKSKGVVAYGWFGQVFAALVKPPEHKEKSADDKQISGADQAVVDAIEDKARHASFEVSIRLVASSNVTQRAQSILNNLIATFALYNSPGKNGFKFTEAKDIDSFITSYILRFFPQENKKTVLNSVELATLFHFPEQSSIPTTQLERQASKQVDGPRNIPDTGLLLGYNIFRGAKKRINIEIDDRRRHLYLVGQTGTGKSTFLKSLAIQDMLNGDGFAFIDPHGDVAEEILSMVPKDRTEDVVYFCPADMEYPLGLNMFEFDKNHPEQKDFLIQESINLLYKLYDPQRQGIIGPRFERIFTNSALLLMADPKGGTFVDIPKLLIDADFMKAKLKYTDDQNVLDFWTKEWPNSQRSNEAGEVTSWVVSKFGSFLSNEMMRNIVGQTTSAFDIREIMDNKKILLVNLSKGRTGELNSKLLGMIFVMKFQAAAMSRADQNEEDRQDFSLYVDEFQNFATDSFATILSEARKYHLNLIVANQFTTQLTEEIRDAVFGNVGTIVCYRVGTADAEFLARQFAPMFDIDDLQRIPNFNAVVRTLISGVPTQSFSMAGLPPLGSPNKELGTALKQLVAAKFGRPKAVVDKEITDRISVQSSDKQSSAKKSARPASGSTFLDDWMQKKQDNSFKTPASPFKQSATQPQMNAANNTSVPPPQPQLAQNGMAQPGPPQVPIPPQPTAAAPVVQPRQQAVPVPPTQVTSSTEPLQPIASSSTPNQSMQPNTSQPAAPVSPQQSVYQSQQPSKDNQSDSTADPGHISMSKKQEHTVHLRKKQQD